MTDTEAVFRFSGRAAGSDPGGYYMTRWDQAEKISVVAATKRQASEKALLMLGPHPRFSSPTFGHRAGSSGWAVIWDRIDEEPTNPHEEHR